MIARGEVMTEREQWGKRHRVWVLTSALASPSVISDASVETTITTPVLSEVKQLQQEVLRQEQELERQKEVTTNLELLLDQQKQLTIDSEHRYFELMERLKEAQAISSALRPMLTAPQEHRRKRW